jgi:bisphosphoglycerate-independent phosphoglycerate mutase (AlkP superfamily)
MKIKYNLKLVEKISEDYANVTYFLNGVVVYKVTMPI